eukprot:gene4719-5772_t
MSYTDISANTTFHDSVIESYSTAVSSSAGVPPSQVAVTNMYAGSTIIETMVNYTEADIAAGASPDSLASILSGDSASLADMFGNSDILADYASAGISATTAVTTSLIPASDGRQTVALVEEASAPEPSVATSEEEEASPAVPELLAAAPEAAIAVPQEEPFAVPPEESAPGVAEEAPAAPPEELVSTPIGSVAVPKEEPIAAVPEDLASAVPEDLASAVPEDLASAVPEDLASAFAVTVRMSEICFWGDAMVRTFLIGFGDGDAVLKMLQTFKEIDGMWTWSIVDKREKSKDEKKDGNQPTLGSMFAELAAAEKARLDGERLGLISKVKATSLASKWKRQTLSNKSGSGGEPSGSGGEPSGSGGEPAKADGSEQGGAPGEESVLQKRLRSAWKRNAMSNMFSTAANLTLKSNPESSSSNKPPSPTAVSQAMLDPPGAIPEEPAVDITDWEKPTADSPSQARSAPLDSQPAEAAVHLDMPRLTCKIEAPSRILAGTRYAVDTCGDKTVPAGETWEKSMMSRPWPLFTSKQKQITEIPKKSYTMDAYIGEVVTPGPLVSMSDEDPNWDNQVPPDDDADRVLLTETTTTTTTTTTTRSFWAVQQAHLGGSGPVAESYQRLDQESPPATPDTDTEKAFGPPSENTALAQNRGAARTSWKQAKKVAAAPSKAHHAIPTARTLFSAMRVNIFRLQLCIPLDYLEEQAKLQMSDSRRRQRCSDLSTQALADVGQELKEVANATMTRTVQKHITGALARGGGPVMESFQEDDAEIKAEGAEKRHEAAMAQNELQSLLNSQAANGRVSTPPDVILPLDTTARFPDEKAALKAKRMWKMLQKRTKDLPVERMIGTAMVQAFLGIKAIMSKEDHDEKILHVFSVKGPAKSKAKLARSFADMTLAQRYTKLMQLSRRYSIVAKRNIKWLAKAHPLGAIYLVRATDPFSRSERIIIQANTFILMLDFRVFTDCPNPFEVNEPCLGYDFCAVLKEAGAGRMWVILIIVGILTPVTMILSQCFIMAANANVTKKAEKAFGAAPTAVMQTIFVTLYAIFFNFQKFNKAVAVTMVAMIGCMLKPHHIQRAIAFVLSICKWIHFYTLTALSIIWHRVRGTKRQTELTEEEELLKKVHLISPVEQYLQKLAYFCILVAWVTCAFSLLTYSMLIREMMGADAETELIRAWATVLAVEMFGKEAIKLIVLRLSVDAFMQKIEKLFTSQDHPAFLWFEQYIMTVIMANAKEMDDSGDQDMGDDADADGGGDDEVGGDNEGGAEIDV